MIGKTETRNDRIIRGIRNVFRLEKENKDTTIRNIKNLFQHEEEDYYKPVIVTDFLSNNFLSNNFLSHLKIDIKII